MTARMSACGTYRYSLHRDWLPIPPSSGGNAVTFVMLNPSTADATADDPTIRRCKGFATALGYSALVVVNLYALRSTDPAALWEHPDPVGPENDEHLARALEYASMVDAPVIAAWGVNARPDRVAAFMALRHADRVTALGLTKNGAPRHPLYLPATARPAPWEPPTYKETPR